MLKDNVLHLMQQKSWCQRDLARATGLTESCISFIVNGKRPTPDYTTLAKLSAALGVSIEELMADKSLPLSS